MLRKIAGKGQFSPSARRPTFHIFFFPRRLPFAILETGTWRVAIKTLTITFPFVSLLENVELPTVNASNDRRRAFSFGIKQFTFVIQLP